MSFRVSCEESKPNSETNEECALDRAKILDKSAAALVSDRQHRKVAFARVCTSFNQLAPRIGHTARMQQVSMKRRSSSRVSMLYKCR